jgi:hypothetical protein
MRARRAPRMAIPTILVTCGSVVFPILIILAAFLQSRALREVEQNSDVVWRNRFFNRPTASFVVLSICIYVGLWFIGFIVVFILLLTNGIGGNV